MTDDTLKRVATILKEGVVGSRAKRLDADTPLLSTGLNLDSTAVLELILKIEEEFSIEFLDEDLSVELFRTVGTLATVIETKLLARANT